LALVARAAQSLAVDGDDIAVAVAE